MSDDTVHDNYYHVYYDAFYDCPYDDDLHDDMDGDIDPMSSSDQVVDIPESVETIKVSQSSPIRQPEDGIRPKKRAHYRERGEWEPSHCFASRGKNYMTRPGWKEKLRRLSWWRGATIEGWKIEKKKRELESYLRNTPAKILSEFNAIKASNDIHVWNEFCHRHWWLGVWLTNEEALYLRDRLALDWSCDTWELSRKIREWYRYLPEKRAMVIDRVSNDLAVRIDWYSNNWDDCVASAKRAIHSMSVESEKYRSRREKRINNMRKYHGKGRPRGTFRTIEVDDNLVDEES